MKQTRRIQLPSGKVIEVVVGVEIEGQEEYDALIYGIAPRAQEIESDSCKGPGLNLHICPRCEGEMVTPVAWVEHDRHHWEITLRCPDCEHWQSVVAPQDDCDLYDDKLEDGHIALTADYKRLVTSNFADEIATFIKALKADAILPEDFG